MPSLTQPFRLVGTLEDLDDWTVSASDEDAAYPAANVLSAGYISVYRSTAGTTSVTLTFDRGASGIPWGGMVVAGSNLTPDSATVRLEAAPSIAFSSLTYDSTTVTAVDLSALGARPYTPRGGWSFGFFPSSSITSRYLRLTVDDPDNVDGYVELAAVTGSGYWEGPADDRSSDREMPTEGPERAGWSILSETFAFPAVAPAVADDLLGIARNVQSHAGLLGWTRYPDRSRAQLQRFVGYGSIASPLADASPSGAGSLYRAVTIQLRADVI